MQGEVGSGDDISLFHAGDEKRGLQSYCNAAYPSKKEKGP